MKKIFGLLVLSLTVSAFAQERVILDSKKAEAKGSSATLVRTAKTPKSAEVLFHVTLERSGCDRYETRAYPRTCSGSETRYHRREVCRTETVPASTSNGPRGPRYNPPGNTPAPTTRRVCVWENVPYTHHYTYSCPYTQTVCTAPVIRPYQTTDKVKIKFKNLPALGGSEEETFLVSASDRGVDSSNVVYNIKPVKTVEGRTYEVKKKGLFGHDSFLIQAK